MLMMVFSFLTISAQSFVLQGNNYTPTEQSSGRGSQYVATPYFYKGDTIFVNKNNGRCVVHKVSRNTGKKYSSPVPEDISKDVCRKMNITYNYVKRKR